MGPFTGWFKVTVLEQARRRDHLGFRVHWGRGEMERLTKKFREEWRLLIDSDEV